MYQKVVIGRVITTNAALSFYIRNGGLLFHLPLINTAPLNPTNLLMEITITYVLN